MSNVTENKNYLSPTGFKVTINSATFANLEYFTTSTSLPAIALGAVSIPWRGNQNAVSGEKIDYAPFDLQFIISENMDNYVELFNWIHTNSQQDKFIKADVILHIMSSSNNVNKQIRFVDAFPTNLGQINFSVQNTDVEYVSADASFSYSYFEFI